MKKITFFLLMLITFNIALCQSINIDWQKNISLQGEKIIGLTEVNGNIFLLTRPKTITGPYLFKVIKIDNKGCQNTIFTTTTTGAPQIISFKNNILIYRNQSESVIYLNSNGGIIKEKTIIGPDMDFEEVYDMVINYRSISSKITRFTTGTDYLSQNKKTLKETLDENLNILSQEYLDYTIEYNSFYLQDFWLEINQNKLSIKTKNKILLKTITLPFVAQYISSSEDGYIFISDGYNIAKFLVKKEIYTNIKTIQTDQKKFQIYPNPTNDFFYIQGDEIEQIQIYNLYGRLILEDKQQNGKKFHLPQGIYICKINNTFNKKIIIN